MAGLSSKVKAYAAANGVADVDFSNDVKLQDNSDGKGAFIAEWNLAISKTTDAHVADVEADEDTAEENATVVEARRAAYGSLEAQVEFISEKGWDD